MKPRLPRRLVRPAAIWWRLHALEFPPILVASVILACGMGGIGAWVGHRMEEGILQSAASETVLNMDNFIKPLVQELATQSALSPAAQASLSAMIMGKALGRDVAAIKIWSPSGTVVFSNRAEMIGETYPSFANLREALTGRVVAEFDDLDDDENQYERTIGAALLEIYAPVRESGTSRIIAVAEFYEIRDSLQLALRTARLQTWAVIGLLTVVMITSLSLIMIKQKRQALERRIAELLLLLAENDALHSRIRNAQFRVAEINELFLRRVSAELHDAPAQLIGFALLRLDALLPDQFCHSPPNGGSTERRKTTVPQEFERVRDALVEAMNEIRTISAGLAPPELADLSLSQALCKAASAHEQRTGTAVDRDIAGLPDDVNAALKICLFRFVQEGLNNAFRHADGRGQQVRARCEEGRLEVAILNDAAPDCAAPNCAAPNCAAPSGHARLTTSSGGLGLRGLRGRIESLGGVFEFEAPQGRRTRLVASFNLVGMELVHV